MRSVLAIARKEFIHIRREPRTLVAVLVMPLFLLFLFTYAISLDVKDIPTAVLDQDLSQTSRAYVNALTNSKYFVVKARLRSLSEVDGVFDRSEERAVVIIEPGFGQHIASGRAGSVAVLLDGSEPNSAQIGQAYAQGLSRVFSGRVTASKLQALGVNPDLAQAGIEPRARLWYNPEANSAFFMVPGLLVILTLSVSVQQTAASLVTEKDMGTLEQLIASPVTRLQLMLGKVLPWAVVSTLNVLIITAAALFVFRIPFRGDPVLFGVAALLFVLAALGLGLIISARASSTEVANQFAILLSLLPAFMLSGFVFPIANMPKVVQFATYIFPARYFMTVSRGSFLKGAGWPVLWPNVAALAVYASVAILIASLLHRRRL